MNNKLHWSNIRDAILLMAGIIFLFIEAFIYKGQVTERPLFLAVYTAMMGLPYVFRGKDDKKDEDKESE